MVALILAPDFAANLSLPPFAVHLIIFFHPLAQPSEYVMHQWIAMLRPSVMHPFSVACCFYQAGALQVSEVTRHFGLHYAQGIGQFADTGLATGEQIQQTQPCRIGQGSKKKGWPAIYLLSHSQYIYG